MPRVIVNFAVMQQAEEKFRAIKSQTDRIEGDFLIAVRKLDWEVRYSDDVKRTAGQVGKELSGYNTDLRDCGYFMAYAEKQYHSLEKADWENPENDPYWKSFLKAYGVGGLISGTGYISDIYGFYEDFKKANGPGDLLKLSHKIKGFLHDAKKTYSNYKRIGHAVGADTATNWWWKKILGIKPLGRASTAKNIKNRFCNNLTNKTSPFNIKKKIGDFTGKNGVKKAVCKWGKVMLNGVFNYADNKQEQRESGGTMSDERVIAETAVETCVDTVIDVGAKVLVGAAIATVSTAAMPELVIAAASTAVVTAIDVGVECLTGKSTTEWASDFILDKGSDLMMFAAKSINRAPKWVPRLSF